MTGLNGHVDGVGRIQFHAPAVRSDDRFTLALHGHIDNAFTLRAGLSDARAARDDMDALLRLWRDRGNACLPELDGAFALAVWDAQERTLILARDRFGQKPVYYSAQGDGFAFASEAARIAPYPAQPNLNALFHYLTVQSVPSPLCAFHGVSALPHAHCLVWHFGGVPSVRRYWTPIFTHAFAGTLDEASTVLEGLLKNSLARYSDAPRIGALLSGGVDSSLMVALLRETGHDPATFSIGFAEQSFDERPFARDVARRYGTRHHELECSVDLPQLVEMLAAKFGEPFADSSALPTWLALHAVSEAGYSLAVLGDGGDDLFAGYERHLNPFLHSGDAPRDTRIEELCAELDERPDQAALAAALTAGSVKFYTHWARFWGSLKRDVCGDALRKAAEPPASMLLARHIFQHSEARNLLDAIQTFEMDYYLPCTLTAKVEVPARACGLPTLAPFLCNDIAVFALSLPTAFRVAACDGPGSFGLGFETKRVVKRLAERYLPREIVYRRKMGFGVPLAGWLRGPLREMLCDILLGRRCKERGWLAPHTVRRLLEEHMQGVRDWHYPLWALLMLEVWARTFLDAPLRRERE